jgi:surface polysaccharide O-acyltransferase-like enzyme
VTLDEGTSVWCTSVLQDSELATYIFYYVLGGSLTVIKPQKVMVTLLFLSLLLTFTTTGCLEVDRASKDDHPLKQVLATYLGYVAYHDDLSLNDYR